MFCKDEKVCPGSQVPGEYEVAALPHGIQKCSLCLQGLLREETHTCANFASHLYIISLYHALCSFSICIHLVPTMANFHFCKPTSMGNALVLQHHAPCEAQRSRTKSSSNSCRCCFSLANLSHAQQVCIQPCTMTAAY